MERAASASELLGFQSIDPATAGSSPGYQRLAERVVEIMAERRAAEAAAAVRPERTP